MRVVNSDEVTYRTEGKWIVVKSSKEASFKSVGTKCSKCDYYLPIMLKPEEFNFCPNCGADMRGNSE